AAYKHKVHGNTYPLDEFTKMKLTAQHDNFLYKNVVAMKIESSSSSGGGGGHSGGGGGHSGGRSF
ncbi:MAG: TPM domain-containing protein, partial [Clostridia bacterium]|nr:TPM domain-containing protein [Clostridia bacterium]